MKKQIEATVRFKGPINYRLLHPACMALGIDPDVAMINPRKAIKEGNPTIKQLQDFVDIVTIPKMQGMSMKRQRVNLLDMELDAAKALGDNIVADFFLDRYRRKLKRLNLT